MRKLRFNLFDQDKESRRPFGGSSFFYSYVNIYCSLKRLKWDFSTFYTFCLGYPIGKEHMHGALSDEKYFRFIHLMFTDPISKMKKKSTTYRVDGQKERREGSVRRA